MKQNVIYVGVFLLVFTTSCIGQGIKDGFNSFVQRNFIDIQLPVKSDTLKPGNGRISDEEIRKFFSKTRGTFYGKVDWEGYAPYEYRYPSWVFKRSSNVKCLIYSALRYGGQKILATYDDGGKMIDTLVLITGIDLGPDHDLYQVFTVERDFTVKAIKLTDECIRNPKYVEESKTWIESLYKGQVDTIYYKIDEDGKFRHLSTITRKGLLFMDSKSGKVEVDSVKAGLK